MGLDQTLYVKRGTEEYEELSYWRKHPNLQGFMEEAWITRGGQGEFNCVDFEIDLEILNQLEKAIIGNELPLTTGFFFGTSDISEEQREYDLEQVEKARKCLEEGETVVYSSWW